MNLPPNAGTVAALVGSAVSAVVAFTTAFGLYHFSQDQTTVVITASTFFAGLGVLVFAALHSWQTQTYDVGQVTSILTTAGGYVLSLLSAFNVFHATVAQQAAVTGISGVLGTLGLFLFGALHVKAQVQAQKVAGKRL